MAACTLSLPKAIDLVRASQSKIESCSWKGLEVEEFLTQYVSFFKGVVKHTKRFAPGRKSAFFSFMFISDKPVTTFSTPVSLFSRTHAFT